MTDKIKIQNSIFKTSPKLKKEMLNYLTLIDENFSSEIANDLKQSMAESLAETCQNDKDNQISEADFIKIVAQIGEFQKPIYKTFLRYKGCLTGVCAGIATYFNIRTIWIRSFFAIPILFLISFTLDFFRILRLPFFGSVFFDVQEGDKYFAKPILNSYFDLSVWIILIYVLIWISTSKVKTEQEEKQLKSDWFFNEEIEKSIFNKITLKNKWQRRILTKVFLVVAKIGVFAFDVAISVTNNIFKSWFARILFGIIFIYIIMILSYLILNNVFIKPQT